MGREGLSIQVMFELTRRSQLGKKSGLEHLGRGNGQSPSRVSLICGRAVSVGIVGGAEGRVTL